MIRDEEVGRKWQAQRVESVLEKVPGAFRADVKCSRNKVSISMGRRSEALQRKAVAKSDLPLDWRVGAFGKDRGAERGEHIVLEGKKTMNASLTTFHSNCLSFMQMKGVQWTVGILVDKGMVRNYPRTQ